MVNANILNLAGIDYNDGLKRFLNDSNLYEAVLTAFIDDDVLERARDAYNSGDTDRLGMAIHEAKGTTGNVGLESVYTAAGTLVTLLRAGEYTADELSEAYKHFDDEYTRVYTAIKEALGT